MLACGLTAISLGKELHWDLANYHYYGPYAFLNHRWTIDYWPPSNLPLYLNPMIDLLPYFFIQHLKPIWVTFSLGAIHGINVWLLYLICYRMLPIYKRMFTPCIALILAMIGIYGPVSFSEMGSFMGDNLVSIFILTAILFQIKLLQALNQAKALSYNYLFISGFSLGVGVGLKFTAGLFIIGFVLSMLILPLPIKTKFKLIMGWSLAVLVGQLVTSGYWMMFLWQHYQNPFFPFFNAIFKSPDFLPINFIDLRFMPKSIAEQLFFPFYFSWRGQVTDGLFTDFRFAILYLCLVAALGKRLWQRTALASFKADLSWLWLMSFFVCSYIIWQIFSSNFRYIVTLEMLTPLLIYQLIFYIFNSVIIREAMLTGLAYVLIFCMIPMGNSRSIKYVGNYFNITLPAFVQHVPRATVLIAFSNFTLTARPRPLSYLIPSFPANWRFIGVPFNGATQYILPDKVKLLLYSTAEIYLLTWADTMPSFFIAAQELGYRKNGECESIVSDRDPYGILICPMVKVYENLGGAQR
jgi:hypothetical protein